MSRPLHYHEGQFIDAGFYGSIMIINLLFVYSGEEINTRSTLVSSIIKSRAYLRYIQKLLGHGSSKTTARYMHVSKKALQDIQRLLDRGRNHKKLKDEILRQEINIQI